MKTNRQIKRMIASVTGGEWAPDTKGKPRLNHSLHGMFGNNVITFQVSKYHKVLSIKASEETEMKKSRS